LRIQFPIHSLTGVGRQVDSIGDHDRDRRTPCIALRAPPTRHVIHAARSRRARRASAHELQAPPRRDRRGGGDLAACARVAASRDA